MPDTASREAHAAMTQAVTEMQVWGSIFLDTQVRLANAGVIVDGFMRPKSNEDDTDDA